LPETPFSSWLILRERFALEYRKTEALYYQGQPDFDAMVVRIHQYIDAM